MEVSELRRRVRELIDRARRESAERRERNDAAGRAWDELRERVVVPLCRQLANVLRAEGHLFQVSTPEARVLITPERSTEDGIEFALSTSGSQPAVVCRVTRVRGREILADEYPVAEGAPIDAITEHAALAVLLRALAPFVER